uniref:Connexin N-terminal domain-containing protein n=3 Tax=Micrurus surinamensis TaxID=129470 RepID=A0A2D4P899_MICSU
MAAAELHPSLKEATSERNVAAFDAKISSPSTWHLAAFAFLVILILVMELVFLWVVTALQIPLVSEMTFRCLLRRQACPPTLECTMLGQVDKQVALWGLIFTAIVNVVVCLFFLLLRLVKIFRCH